MAPDSDESRERLETRSESSSERGDDPAERDDGPAERDDDLAGQDDDPVEARLEDALERVAHGATISVPSILL